MAEAQVSCVLALGRRGQRMHTESRRASRAAAGPFPTPPFVQSTLMPQVCPVESQWVQAILPRLEGIDVNRLR